MEFVMQAIKFDNVDFSYEESGKKAVNNLSFVVNEGEFVAVVGRNGSGKSTAAKLINGLIRPSSGSIIVNGITIDKDTTDSDIYSVRKKVGMVFQNPDNQMVATIVEDDIAFGPENLGILREEIGERIEFALNATDTQKFRHRASAELSGGQKQRVAIAGALALKPQILILDEATSMLDPKGRAEVNQIVRNLNKQNGMTVITVTHYMEEAAAADRVLVLNGGKIDFFGTPEQVFAREDDLLRCGLMLPRAAYIFQRLKERGILSGKTALSEQELEVKLCELFART